MSYHRTVDEHGFLPLLCMSSGFSGIQTIVGLIWASFRVTIHVLCSGGKTGAFFKLVMNTYTGVYGL